MALKMFNNLKRNGFAAATCLFLGIAIVGCDVETDKSKQIEIDNQRAQINEMMKKIEALEGNDSKGKGTYFEPTQKGEVAEANEKVRILRAELEDEVNQSIAKDTVIKELKKQLEEKSKSGNTKADEHTHEDHAHGEEDHHDHSSKKDDTQKADHAKEKTPPKTVINPMGIEGTSKPTKVIYVPFTSTHLKPRPKMTLAMIQDYASKIKMSKVPGSVNTWKASLNNHFHYAKWTHAESDEGHNFIKFTGYAKSEVAGRISKLGEKEKMIILWAIDPNEKTIELWNIILNGERVQGDVTQIYEAISH